MIVYGGVRVGWRGLRLIDPVNLLHACINLLKAWKRARAFAFFDIVLL